ncbi:hypothetical protein [Streptomyces coeruleorubidus]
MVSDRQLAAEITRAAGPARSRFRPLAATDPDTTLTDTRHAVAV